ncbi:hypothetical protein D3C77_751280 [compost metagenome]
MCAIGMATPRFQLANQGPRQLAGTHASRAADAQLPPGALACGSGKQLVLAVIALFQRLGLEAGGQFRQQVTAAPVLQ